MKKVPRIVLYIAALVLLGFGVFVFFKYLKISRIRCESQFGPCSESVETKLGELQGYGILETFTRVNKTLKEDRRISEYSVRYIIPNTLSVYVIEKKSVIALGKQGTDRFVILDKDYKVIGIEKSTFLPIVNVSSSEGIDFGLGSDIPSSLLFAAKIGKEMFMVYGVKLSVVYNDRVEVKLTNGPKVIFPLGGEIDVLMGSLNLILSRLNNASGEIRIGEVDLRYKNPVIR